VIVTRAAIRFFGAGLNFGAVTTLNTRLVDAPPGATVRSISEPWPASTRPSGPVIVPGLPLPPTVSEPMLRPSFASAASA
jgi:hypothetical protein